MILLTYFVLFPFNDVSVAFWTKFAIMLWHDKQVRFLKCKYKADSSRGTDVSFSGTKCDAELITLDHIGN